MRVLLLDTTPALREQPPTNHSPLAATFILIRVLYLLNLEIESSLTGQLSTLIQKNGFLCQKIEHLQRSNTDLEYKFSIMTSELERARREYSDLQAKYELRSASYADLKAVCYQLDAQLNGKSISTPTSTSGTTATMTAIAEGVTATNGALELSSPETAAVISRSLLESDRKKRRLSIELADGADSDSGYMMSYEDGSNDSNVAEGSMVRPMMMPLPLATLPQRQASPTHGPTQSTWTCLWKGCNQVFGALDWLVGHVEEFHIGLGKVRFLFLSPCMFPFLHSNPPSMIFFFSCKLYRPRRFHIVLTMNLVP